MPATFAPNPILTVDAVLIGLFGRELKVALLERTATTEPEVGKLALPGGFVRSDTDTDAEAALRRMLKDKLDGFKPRHMEQVCTVSGKTRDPRGWSASIVYLVLCDADHLQRLTDQGTIRLVTLWPRKSALPPDLAFDHKYLIAQALERLRTKAAYSTLCAHLLPALFSLTDFRHACEVVLDRSLNAANFRRKLLEGQVLKEGTMLHQGGRPAQGYSLRRDTDFLASSL